MSLSGSCGNTFRTGYRLQIDWTATQSITNNTSTVTAKLYLISLGSSYYINASALNTNHIYLDGSTYSNSNTSALSANEKRLLFTQSKTITHNSDGTKTFSLGGDRYMNVTLSGVFWGTVTIANTNFTLDTIPRTSTPTLSSNPTNMNSAVTIYTNRASTSFTHTLSYTFGSASGTIATGVGDSYAWTIPLSLASQVPNATSGTGTITCVTYSGSTSIGTKSISFSANVPSTVVPSFTSITASEANSTVTGVVGTGKYVQNLSKVAFAINGATGTYGSTITSYNINFNGINYTSASVTTGTINATGTKTATATITDSRGRTAQKTADLSFLSYYSPQINGFSLIRCLSDGTIDNSNGTYVKVISIGSVSSLINSTEKNTLTYRIYSKVRGTIDWGIAQVSSTISSLSLDTTNILETYDLITSYDFKLDVVDKFNTITSVIVLSTAEVTMSWGKTGIGVGKVWEQGALDVSGDIYFNGYRQNDIDSLPSGDGSLAYWHALPQGRYYCGSGMLTGQPTTWGLVDKIGGAGDFSVLWFTQDKGDIYRLSGNSGGLSGWIRIVISSLGSYGGGWYMSDTSWIRAYNNKGIYTPGMIYSSSEIRGDSYCTSDRLRGKTSNERVSLGSGNCRFDTTGGTLRLYASAYGSADYGIAINSNGQINFTVNSSALSYISTGGEMIARGFTATEGCNLQLKASSSASTDPGDIIFENSSASEMGRMYVTANGYLVVRGSGNVFGPSQDGNTYLGCSTNRWKQVYAVSSTIATSDRNEKNTIESIPDQKAKDFIMALNPVTYKFNDGDSGRTHWGMISQDVYDEMLSIGLTDMDFAGFIRDKKYIHTVDERGHDTTTEVEGENSYGLRYEEFIAPIIKVIQAQQRKIQELEQRINILEVS